MHAVIVTMPAYWASYLVNGDASGLLDGEEFFIERRLKECLPDGGSVVSMVEGSERFTWSFDRYGGDARGGDVVDYVALVASQDARQAA